jgi:hypothetical protein
MAYPAVTNTFVESTTAYATAVNQNFLDIVNGISDGTKDIRVNDASIAGNMTLANALTSRTILPGVADTYDLGSAAGAWNKVWTNELNVESMAVSAAGKTQYRETTNYVNSDNSGYLDLHANTNVRINNPAQVTGSFVVSGALQAATGTVFGGTAVATAGATVDIQGIGGLALPRLTTAQRDALTTQGLTVYNTTLGAVQSRESAAWTEDRPFQTFPLSAASLTGWDTATVNWNVSYRVQGRVCFMNLAIFGTATSAKAEFKLPITAASGFTTAFSLAWTSPLYNYDTAVGSYVFGYANASTGTCFMYPQPAALTWASTGNRTVQSTIWYMV